ncbi:SPOR domain-containing protein [Varunaivibrio sulfuroxidans]|uniref:Cell division septation protein DedD n=1 Tax=Varunaivibrio sulfuroxidans TaxID=1773489 RepID=A0A4R3J7C7_9PROT|nr:SPOR domain-containing protein [Varunaivibrio sulfuroxidans]TCS61327.1 cell division septation protein DedD [Varunaivibrio sulfuroxidans]WES31060.1 SPOR domain-containing protein [Varunaivibrio sulfuroxidans]
MSKSDEQNEHPDDVPAASDVLEFEPLAQSDPPRRTAVKIVLILLALIVLGGGVTWFYWGNELAVKAGYEAPVIHAESTPYKVRPADPGGMAVPDRDKLVYNRMNGQDVPLPPVEQLLAPAEQPIAPPQPAPAAQGIPVPPPATPDLKKIAGGRQKLGRDIAKATVPPVPPAQPGVPTPSTAKAVTGGAPLPQDLSQSLKNVLGETAAPAPSVVSPAPNLNAAAQPAAEAPQGKAVSAASLQGAYLVQLAAVRDRAVAQSEWDRLQKANPDLLGTLKLHVMDVKLAGKGVFYRLRAGPLPSENAAKKLCAELAKRKEGCLIVRP